MPLTQTQPLHTVCASPRILFPTPGPTLIANQIPNLKEARNGASLSSQFLALPSPKKSWFSLGPTSLSFLFHLLPPAFLGVPSPNLSVSPQSQLSLCPESSEPCLSHLGPGSLLHDQPGGLAGACASRAPRLHDNLVFAGSLAIPEASRPFLLPPPPRWLSPVTWPGSADPAPWRLRAVLLEGHLGTRPTSPL